MMLAANVALYTKARNLLIAGVINVSLVHALLFSTSHLIRPSTIKSQKDRYRCDLRVCNIKHATHVLGNCVIQCVPRILKASASYRPTKMMLMSFAGSRIGLKMIHLFVRLDPVICGDPIVKLLISVDNPQPWKQKIAKVSLKLIVLPLIRHKPVFAARIIQKVAICYLHSAEQSQLKIIIFVLQAVFSEACACLWSPVSQAGHTNDCGPGLDYMYMYGTTGYYVEHSCMHSLSPFV